MNGWMDEWMGDRVVIIMYNLGFGREWAKLHIVTF